MKKSTCVMIAVGVIIVLLAAGLITLGVLLGEEIKKNEELRNQQSTTVIPQTTATTKKTTAAETTTNGKPPTTTANDSPTECSTRECVEVAGTIISSMDISVDPCQDFYKYSCGGYEKKTSLPSGFGKYSKSSEADHLLQQNLRDLLEKSPAVPGDSSAQAKAHIYYQACLNDTKIDKEGKAMLIEIKNGTGGLFLNEGNTVPGDWSFETMLHYRDQYSLGQLFSFYVAADMKNVSNNILTFDQASLGMGRDYYLDNKYANILEAYKTLLTTYAKLILGEDMVDDSMIQDVVDFETKLANLTIPAADLRDPAANYKKYALKELDTKFPDVMNWKGYFQSLFATLKPPISVGEDEPVVVNAEAYFVSFNELLKSKVIADVTMQNYIALRVLAEYAPNFGDDFKAANDAFNEVLTGSNGSIDRWQICVSETDNAVGSGLGALYVDAYFPEDSKVKIEDLIVSIKTAFTSRLKAATWMDEETKDKALQKMKKLTYAAAYPDYIKNDTYLEVYYADLTISDSYVNNSVNQFSFTFKRLFGKLHEPVDNTIWGMTPQTINAYYSPTQNKFVIPAGILTGPFFYQSNSIPSVINYAAVGTVIGHEIGHGFDDQGSQYDGNGNLENWWSNETLKDFEEKAQCLVNQYNKFEYDGVNVNGELTLGENIGDNGGIQASYLAYTTDIHKESVLVGMELTAEQLFFVAYAQVHCTKYSSESLQNLMLTDPHSPTMARVNGPLANHEAFAKAFNCKQNDPLNPTTKCVVW